MMSLCAESPSFQQMVLKVQWMHIEHPESRMSCADIAPVFRRGEELHSNVKAFETL